jgi:hypothetical protein
MLHGGAKQHIRTLALALQPNIMMNSISMSWQRICLPLMSYVVDVDDQAIVWRRYQVMLATVLSSHADDDVVVSYWQWRYRVLLVLTLPR